MLTKVHFQLIATPEISWGRLLSVGPKVKKPTTGRMSRAGNLRTVFETFSQLPRAWWREKRARAALKRKTKIMLQSRVFPSLGQRGGGIYQEHRRRTDAALWCYKSYTVLMS